MDRQERKQWKLLPGGAGRQAGRQRAAHLGNGTRQARPQHTQSCSSPRPREHLRWASHTCICWRGLASSKPQALPPSLGPHRMVRPLKSLPLRLRMADSAVGMSKNSMKPNPRGLPVSRSVTILRSSGSPRTRQFNEAGRAPAAPPPHRLR